MPTQLTRDTLLSIEQLLKENHSLPLLSADTWQTVKLLGINRELPTRRGFRGGKHLQRRIPVRITANRDLGLPSITHYSTPLSSVTHGSNVNSGEAPPTSAPHVNQQQQVHRGANLENLASVSKSAQQIPVRATTRNWVTVSAGKSHVCKQNLTAIPRAPLQRLYSSKKLKVCCLNPRSIKNKTDSLCDFIVTNDFDIVALTETWLGSKLDKVCVGELVPTGYSIKHVPRQDGRAGGGVAVLHKLGLSVKILSSSADKAFTHFEHMDCHISADGHTTRLAVVYRPPPSSRNGLKNSVFFQEWPLFMEGFITCQLDTIILGDMNIHLDEPTDPTAARFISTLHSHGMSQLVLGPTHIKGHTLDVVIVKDTHRCVHDLEVTDPVLCDQSGNTAGDHYAVTFTTTMSKPCPIQRKVTYRKLRAINIEAFKQDIASSASLVANQSSTVEELQRAYNEDLRKLVDSHAPLRTRMITLRPHAPWYTEELRDSKRQKRKLEKQWRLSKLEVHHQLYREYCAQANKLLRHAQISYYSQKVVDSGNNKQSLFKVAKHLLGEESSSPLPQHNSAKDLAEAFSSYFCSKITTIRDDLDAIPAVDSNQPFPDMVCDVQTLSDFTPTTEEEVRKLIMGSASKSCDLDPIPTWLLKDCLELLLPLLTSIVNASLSSSTVPTDMKHAQVRPLLKKPGLDADNLKNYRPVSNLTFTSKLVEKVVASRLDQHFDLNNLNCQRQSAYRKCHSTETALLKVTGDILTALDDGQACVLVLLDLSAAFDTLDHTIMLNRLRSTFGVTGSALSWFASYLNDRYQSVVIDGETSTPRRLKYGVPQGSVLGPKLYSAYVKPLGDGIQESGVPSHFYADDTQLHRVFNPCIPEAHTATVSTLVQAVEQIGSWMTYNKLKLNQDKTEVITITSKHKPSIPPVTLQIGSATVKSKPKVRNLGVLLDSNMTMEDHVNSVCRSAYAHLSTIGRIRRYLTPEAAKSLVHALVTSRLDYCNSLLYGLPKVLLDKLQHVQHVSARVITRTPRYQHITPVLKELHWLPMEKRIQFKMLVHAHRAVHGNGPTYLQDFVVPYKPSRQLRSANDTQLVIPRTKTVSYGQRSFRYAAPYLWNRLPYELRNVQNLHSFRKALKTHLFKLVYS